jgi:2-oxoglutarate ferredoxin oxidoreductase subunit gamma
MATIELKIGGFGGQGVILSGQVIGKAAALFGGKHSAMTQSFGPEARGSACSSQVIVSSDPILYPYVRRPDILVVMSQEAYEKFSPALNPEGMLVYESELVSLGEGMAGVKKAGIPSTRIAEELGRKIVSNIVMTGFFTAVTDVVSRDAMEQAVRDSVPPGTERLNLAAFGRGYEYGESGAWQKA